MYFESSHLHMTICWRLPHSWALMLYRRLQSRDVAISNRSFCIQNRKKMGSDRGKNELITAVSYAVHLLSKAACNIRSVQFQGFQWLTQLSCKHLLAGVADHLPFFSISRFSATTMTEWVNDMIVGQFLFSCKLNLNTTSKVIYTLHAYTIAIFYTLLSKLSFLSGLKGKHVPLQPHIATVHRDRPGSSWQFFRIKTSGDCCVQREGYWTVTPWPKHWQDLPSALHWGLRCYPFVDAIQTYRRHQR